MATTFLFRKLIDGRGEDPLPRAALRVDGGRIVWIGRETELTRPREDTVVDANDLTAMPGMVNAHDHVAFDAVVGKPIDQIANEPIEYVAMRAVKNARLALRAGETTIRDLGARGRVSSMLKRLIGERIVPGPRMLVAGRNIVRTGGLGWFLGRTADGADGFRQAIRAEILENGVDLVKIMVTGGVAAPEPDALRPEMTQEEITAAVQEAHRLGRKVAAHGSGGPGVKAAIEAGVDSIEHGAFLSDEDVTAMVRRGIFLVSTLGVLEKIVAFPRPNELPDRARAGIERVCAIVGQAQRSGLRVAVGTDPMHGQLHREIAFLVRAGYSTVEAIAVATRNGAELCGILDFVGTLEIGKAADVIAVRGDVVSDVSNLKNVDLVMKAGVVEFATEHESAWGNI